MHIRYIYDISIIYICINSIIFNSSRVYLVVSFNHCHIYIHTYIFFIFRSLYAVLSSIYIAYDNQTKC